MLVLPIVAYGYTGHVMDFPGTINNDFEHFMHHVLDITKSLAYHGFKKIILLNGHGSNMPNLDLVARRTNLETDAECVLAAWWNLLTVDKEFLPRWRQSKFPGGCAPCLRIGDVAVSLPRRRKRPQGQDQERHDQLQRGEQPVQLGRSVRAGPATVVSWTSSYSDTGVLGEAEWRRPKKAGRAERRGRQALGRFAAHFKDLPAYASPRSASAKADHTDSLESAAAAGSLVAGKPTADKSAAVDALWLWARKNRIFRHRAEESLKSTQLFIR